jgi:hypothetical protein
MVVKGWQFGGSPQWWSCEMSMVGFFVHVTSYGRMFMGLFFLTSTWALWPSISKKSKSK